MTQTQGRALEKFLFGDENAKLVNFKLLRGDTPDISEDDICAQVESAIEQVASGKVAAVKDFPTSGDSMQFSVRELEKSL